MSIPPRHPYNPPPVRHSPDYSAGSTHRERGRYDEAPQVRGYGYDDRSRDRYDPPHQGYAGPRGKGRERSRSPVRHAPYHRDQYQGHHAAPPHAESRIDPYDEGYAPRVPLPRAQLEAYAAPPTERWENGRDVRELDNPYGYAQPYTHAPYNEYRPVVEQTAVGLPYDAPLSGAHPASYAEYQDLQAGEGYARGGDRREPNPKSRDVIFLGLESTYTEEAMLEFLRTDCAAHVDKTTIVRDRATGEARGFGFASFSSQSAADRFIQAHFPHIAMPSMYPNNPPMNIKIDYAGTTAGPSTAGGVPGQGRPGWQDSRAAALGGNEGMRDIAPAGNGNRVLLMRGLAPDSEQEEIRDRIGAEIVRLATTSSPAMSTIADGRGAIQRIILIRNKYTKQCLGFGFIQLVSTHLASALLAHLLSRTAQPVGFVINGRPIACSFANANAFADVGPGGVAEAWCIPVHGKDRQLVGGIGGPASEGEENNVGWVKYWDDSCGASELPVATENEAPLEPPLQSFLDGLAAAAAVEGGQTKEAPTSAPGSGAGTPLASGGLVGAIKMVPLKIGGKKKEQDAMVALPVSGIDKSSSGGPSNVFGQQEEEEPAALPSKTYPGRGKQGAALGSANKKTASFISKWNNKQEELKAAPVANPPPAGVSAANATFSHKPVESRASPAAVMTEDFDYRDPSKMACLLCQRQFKSMEILGRHCNKSDLHKARIRFCFALTRSVVRDHYGDVERRRGTSTKNLLDDATCQAGRVRKQAAMVTSSEQAAAPAYRDRAAERRSVFNQPAMPLPEASRANKRKFLEAPVAPPKPEPGLEPAQDESNKGNQLLKKMGWSAGTGLGLEGEGRVAPVEALLYGERVGLGATKGRDPTKYQGAEGYASMAKDGARQRYEKS